MSNYRLPTSVRPRHYDLIVKTDLDGLTFSGRVKIDLDVKDDTTHIVLNSAPLLTLSSVELQSDALGNTQPEISRVIDIKKERVTFYFAKAMPAGSKAQLHMSFSGQLSNTVKGYYKSSYKDEDGNTKFHSCTMLAPIGARMAFPCWDEPALKATFAITLVSKSEYVNLSNMPIVSESREAGSGWKTTEFATTPPMSTYLVAYATGPFQFLEESYISPLTGKKRPLRVYATQQHIEQQKFALEVQKTVLPLYEQIFDIEYPLPKLDTLVVEDFEEGAMENWGLIVGRTSIYNVLADDILSRKRTGTVHTHEIAHQWFGNIVTMEWWDNLYLNEGFATLMGDVLVTNKVWPEWNVNSSFINDRLNVALVLDAQPSSHPIELNLPDAHEAIQFFDTLSYSKSSSVLRMLLYYVGEENMIKGTSKYLKSRLYSNSVSADLWKAISDVSDMNIDKMMKVWMGKAGFPLLTVTETHNGIRVRQDEFRATKSAALELNETNETIWTIPLRLLTVDDDNNPVLHDKLVLDSKEKDIVFDNKRPWKLNAGTIGFYRVLYEPSTLLRIAHEATKTDSIFSSDDRNGLVHDAVALAKDGYIGIDSALSLIRIFRKDPTYLVWKSFGFFIDELRSVWLDNGRVREGISDLAMSLFVPLVDQLGYDNSDGEPVEVQLLRQLAVYHSVYTYGSVANELLARFRHFMNTGDTSHIPATLMHGTYIAAVRYGGSRELAAIQLIHRESADVTARQAAMFALMAGAQSPHQALEVLEYARAQAKPHDFIYFCSGSHSNHHARRVMFDYFMEHFEEIYTPLKGSFTFPYLISAALESMTTEADADLIAKFFESKDTSMYAAAVQHSIESTRSRAAWIKRSTGEIEHWLDEWEKEPAVTHS